MPVPAIRPYRRGVVVAAVLATALLLGALLWWGLNRISPLPPNHHRFDHRRRRQRLSAAGQGVSGSAGPGEGITVELRPSEGDVENLNRLRDSASGVDVGFLQGGLTSAQESPGLVVAGHRLLPAGVVLLPGQRQDPGGTAERPWRAPALSGPAAERHPGAGHEAPGPRRHRHRQRADPRAQPGRGRDPTDRRPDRRGRSS